MTRLGLIELDGVVVKRARALLLVPALLLPGCTLPKVLGDSPEESSGGTAEGSGEGTAEGTADGSGGPTSGGPSGTCDNPAFTCSVPVDCEVWKCGELGSPFDASGCLRPSCVEDACGADEICYSVGEGDCGALDVIGCSDVEGACACEFSPSCGGAHCIPADEGPPVECAGIQEKAACEAADCSEFTSVAPWSVVEGECVQGPSEPLCMWFPGDAWGGTATPGAFYERATGRANYFSIDWIVPPHGWGSCGDADAPPACACIGSCALAQKEGDDLLKNDPPCEDASDCVLVDALCYEGNKCGSVAVNVVNEENWSIVEENLQFLGCCAGADPCGATAACEDQRCVAKFP